MGELLIATNAAKIYRTHQESLQSSVYCEGALGPMRDVAISSNSELYAVAGAYLYVYDFCELQLVTMCRTSVPNCCLAFSEDLSQVIAGGEDGFVKAFGVNKCAPVQHNAAWEIVNAHKGAVSSIHVDQQYIITGGNDG